MAATYKVEGYEARNPVMFALSCTETHLHMLESILEKHGDQELISLNNDLLDLIDKGKEYYCLNFPPDYEETLKKDLFNFVTRVLTTYGTNRGNSEVQILPEMTRILLDYLAEKN